LTLLTFELTSLSLVFFTCFFFDFEDAMMKINHVDVTDHVIKVNRYRQVPSRLQRQRNTPLGWVHRFHAKAQDEEKVLPLQPVLLQASRQVYMQTALPTSSGVNNATISDRLEPGVGEFR
jgi:ribosomal protein S12 methylthiotransferase accessory factor YcaO